MKIVTGKVERHTNEAFYYSYYVDFYRFPESMLDMASANLGKTITV